MKDIQLQLEKDGYVVLEDFFSPEEVEEMKTCGEDFTNNLPPENQRKVFNTIELQQNKDEYFMDSAHKISYFFESESLEDNGKLKVHPRISLNKVGHALHWLHPTFKKITFDERVKETAFQLNFQEPAVCQSMYIYKNPGLGSEAHQDAWYLHVDPMKLVGFWIALDDATLENGCLWVAPGSHKSGIHRRFIRNKDYPDSSKEILIYDRGTPCYPASNFRAVPVRRGSCILLDGLVVHFSKANKSDKSRHAYTFHVIETKQTTYAKDNWLQPPENGFSLLYKN